MLPEYWWCSTQTLLRRGDEGRSTKTITVPAARTIVWSLVFVVLLFIYFSVTNISESESVKYSRLLKFFSSHFASYLRGVGCCDVCETISCSQICKINVFSPHTRVWWAWPAAATASPGLHQPSHTNWDKEPMESSSSSSSRAAAVSSASSLRRSCTNYYRAARVV